MFFDFIGRVYKDDYGFFLRKGQDVIEQKLIWEDFNIRLNMLRV